MVGVSFIHIAEDLELAGLVWQPEIGDEVVHREQKELVSILVDPQGMTPKELRTVFVWLPSLEQLVLQVEARQAVLYHAGIEINDANIQYKAVIESPGKKIESHAESLRSALALGLRDLLLRHTKASLH